MTDFDLSTVGDTAPEDTPASEETEARRCTKCNAILPPHEGRGRKPTVCDACKTTRAPRTPRKGTGSTDQALAAMDGIYSTTVVILSLFSPKASATMLAQVETAQRMNRSAFEADKALARRVARWGEVTGGSGFVLAQVAVAAPTLLVLRADLADRKKSRMAKAPSVPETTVPRTESPVPDDLARFA